MIFLALLFNALAFLGLAAASTRYRDALMGRGQRLRFPYGVRYFAAALIGMSLLFAWISSGIALGVVIFVGLSTLGAIISVACITVGRGLRSH